MKCANCGGSSWENVDQYRFKDKDKHGKKINMSICNDCGFVSYPDKWATKEEIKKHYRESYRPAPTAGNLFAGQRKNHFHYAFLMDTFKKWQDEGRQSPAICDVGCAFGMSLQFFKQFFPKAELHGTELTTSMKRVAFHEFGFNLVDEIDQSKTYDMIMSYKVLEHQLDPMDELKLYAKLLKQDGLLYISVPTWFNTITNFGLDGFDLEYYYDPNHINVWTKPMFENMLLRSGFEIIKQDSVMYGDTYLCKVNKKNEELPVYKEKKKDVLEYLSRVKKAWELFENYKYIEAIQIWPNYPQAHIAHLEMNRKEIAEIGFAEFENKYLKYAIQCCPTSPECLIAATDFALRAREYEKTIEYAKKALEAKPNNPVSINHLITVYKEMAIRSQGKQKLEYFTAAKHYAQFLSDVSIQNRDEAINMIYFINSQLPTEFENASYR